MAHPVLASMAYKAMDEAARTNADRARRATPKRRRSFKLRNRASR